MIYKSKAPFRIGLAGGGTDVSPYCELFGGEVVNAAISLYAHVTIEETNEKKISIQSLNNSYIQQFDFLKELPIDQPFDLVKGVYNHFVKNHKLANTGLKISTFLDVPAGSGLGTSSTLVVALVGVFYEMLNINKDSYEIAQEAYQIERINLKLAGGRQDQYAAVFGGINYMQFNKDEKVIVEELILTEQKLIALQNNLVLYYTSDSRNSASIIREQVKNVEASNENSITAMHQLKLQAQLMKKALQQGEVDAIGELLEFGFQQKKLMAHNISNNKIEEIYDAAKSAGATGGKISGAGGGGFMIFYCPDGSKQNVINALQKRGGEIKEFSFALHGLHTWTERII
jgi:D-glycero-alpha-D-manno-heptose-7-phosphate kinase